MSGPDLPPLPRLDPAAEAYTEPPAPLSEHCEAAKDLIRFMRNYGVRAESIEVGKNGVRLLGFTDDYSRKPLANAVNAKPEPLTTDTDDGLFGD